MTFWPVFNFWYPTWWAMELGGRHASVVQVITNARPAFARVSTNLATSASRRPISVRKWEPVPIWREVTAC